MNDILLAMLTAYLFACSKDVQSSNLRGEPTPPDRGNGRASFESSVYPYLIKNCASCHKQVPPQIASNNVDTAYQDTKPLINSSHIELSTLVRKAKDGHCGSVCGTDGSELIRLIQKWNEGESNK